MMLQRKAESTVIMGEKNVLKALPVYSGERYGNMAELSRARSA
jgi:hypothetical protein